MTDHGHSELFWQDEIMGHIEHRANDFNTGRSVQSVHNRLGLYETEVK